ncbi:MAG: C-GCAxxG-C-C family protein [Clostridiales bacterium]|nr:C-GCAxxG-C-C family protein [Clostridiales bacterium]
MTRAEIAKNYFLSGYNCSQAVVLAFSDRLGLPEEKLLALSLPLGGGMGRLRQTCGGVSGAVICLGLLFEGKSKSEMYALVQEFARRFIDRNGSINCGELLSGAHVVADTSPNAEERTPQYYKKRPCADLVYDAAEILETLCNEQKKP